VDAEQVFAGMPAARDACAGTRGGIRTRTGCGLNALPLPIALPGRESRSLRSGRESNSPWAVDSRLASQMRTGPSACLPGEIRTPSAAFGGLRPIHPAGRPPRACVAPGAGLEPAVALRRVVNSHLACHSPHPGKEGERTCRSGPHRGASPDRRTPFRVPPGSRTLLAGLEDRVLAARTAVRMSSAPDLHRHVTRLQLAAYLFRSSGANERTKRRRRESNARDCRRPRCSKPACYHSSTSPMSSPRGDSNA
jgi:hypothetical protein